MGQTTDDVGLDKGKCWLSFQDVGLDVGKRSVLKTRISSLTLWWSIAD
jgi:hypothetical protein